MPLLWSIPSRMKDLPRRGTRNSQCCPGEQELEPGPSTRPRSGATCSGHGLSFDTAQLRACHPSDLSRRHRHEGEHPPIMGLLTEGTKQTQGYQPLSSWGRGTQVSSSLETVKAPNGERSGYVLETFKAVEMTARVWAASQGDSKCLLTIRAKFSQAWVHTSQAKYVHWHFTC